MCKKKNGVWLLCVVYKVKNSKQKVMREKHSLIYFILIFGIPFKIFLCCELFFPARQ